MRTSAPIWNILTLVLLGLTLLVCLWVGIVFAFPQSPVNPLKPPVLQGLTTPSRPSLDATASAAPAVYPSLPPAWTATPTWTPTPLPATATRRPTLTASATVGGPTASPSPVGPTGTPSESPLATRTPTPSPEPPTATSSAGGYPGQPTPPVQATATVGGYP